MTTPTVFDYQILDDQDLKTRTSLYVSYTGATLVIDDLIDAWIDYGTLIDACIDGQIVQGRITIPLDTQGAWKSAPADGNNVNQVMGVHFGNDFDIYKTTFLLPSYKEALLDAEGKPDPADAALAALVSQIIDGSPDGTENVFPNSKSSHDLDEDQGYFLTVRKVRNQRQRTLIIP